MGGLHVLVPKKEKREAEAKPYYDYGYGVPLVAVETVELEPCKEKDPWGLSGLCKKEKRSADTESMEVMAMPMTSGHLTLTLRPMPGMDTAEPIPDTGTDMALGTTAKGPLIPRLFSTVDTEGLTFAFSIFAKISRPVHEMALSKFL